MLLNKQELKTIQMMHFRNLRMIKQDFKRLLTTNIRLSSCQVGVQAQAQKPSKSLRIPPKATVKS